MHYGNQYEIQVTEGRHTESLAVFPSQKDAEQVATALRTGNPVGQINAIGFSGKAIDLVAQDKPEGCNCSSCGMNSCECRKGSLYTPGDGRNDSKCGAWMYWD
jgi:hypothetical protein